MGHNLYAAFTFIIRDYLSCDTSVILQNMEIIPEAENLILQGQCYILDATNSHPSKCSSDSIWI